jgi:hypothetical protein
MVSIMYEVQYTVLGRCINKMFITVETVVASR